MMNIRKTSSKSNSTPNLTKPKSTPTPETPTVPHPHENDQILLENIRTIVRDKLSGHETAIKEIINSNMKSKIERLDKLSTEKVELTKSLEHIQDQLDYKLKT